MEADLIQLEIEHLRNQIELLDAMFDEYTNRKSLGYCESLKIYIIEYLNYGKENVLHKLGYCNTKEE
jgi:hypothetical protein